MRALMAVLMLVTVPTAWAGPPLVCHPIEIGDAESLPAKTSDWRVWKTPYDLDGLVDDTLSLLGPDTPVLVRMETLRRATVHGKKNPAVLGELAAALDERVRDRGDGLSYFDLGYFAATFKQFRLQLETAPALDIDGYALVRRALDMSGGDAEMEFAAALITVHPRRPEHEGHLRAAIDGAEDGSLLARNLTLQFRDRGATMAELRAAVSR